MKVAVVAEFYPRAADPVLGLWAHRQAIAARDAGADVRVLVLYRPLPSLADARGGRAHAARATKRALAQPPRATLDGIAVSYVPFLAPPRPQTYGSWGRWAAPPLAVALRALRRHFAFDLVHAHNAVPAGEAVRRAGLRTPFVVSVHGGDVFHTVPGSPAGAQAVRAALGRARLVIANSGGIEQRCRALGAPATRVVRLGTDLPQGRAAPYAAPTVVTTGHVIARKRHADVLRAVALLRERHPALRYLVIGDGPAVGSLRALAAELGVADRLELTGQLPGDEALQRTRRATLFAMPSTDEAFGVAYVEAMAGWLPAIAATGEPGPQEIVSAVAGDEDQADSASATVATSDEDPPATAGGASPRAAATTGGMTLVAPRDPVALAAAIDGLLSDGAALRDAGERARATVERHFSWTACGAATVAAYEAALA